MSATNGARSTVRRGPGVLSNDDGSLNIGTRIYNLLHPHRPTGTYRVNDRTGEPYVIEFISAIPVPDRRLGSLASAIEEHIITTVRGDVHLLNAVGNSE